MWCLVPGVHLYNLSCRGTLKAPLMEQISNLDQSSLFLERQRLEYGHAEGSFGLSRFLTYKLTQCRAGGLCSAEFFKIRNRPPEFGLAIENLLQHVRGT